MPAAEITEKARLHNQKYDAEQSIRLSQSANARSVYSCKSCGANVLLSESQMVAKCDFCGTSISKSDFPDAKFPQGIIPFFITRAEAVYIFRNWARENSKLQDIDEAVADADNMAGYYLPFEMMRGPIRMDVDARGSIYKCGGYLEGIFISESANIYNEVLDSAEPFDTSSLVNFDFSYIAGHKALLPNVSNSELKLRLLSEVSEVYRDDVSNALGDEAVVFRQSGSELTKNILSNTVYLPMYMLRVGERFAVVNGQTGRVAYGLPYDVQKSYHGFLKRNADGALEKDVHEFPKYKPKKPLFYQTVTDRRGTREVAGVYEEDKELKLDFVLLMIVPAVWIVSAMLMIPFNQPAMLNMAIPSIATIIVFLIFYFKAPVEVNHHFVEVFPKYKNGGAGNDDEVYWMQNSKKSRHQRYNILILTLSAILLCFFSWQLWLGLGNKGKETVEHSFGWHSVKVSVVTEYAIVFHAKPLDKYDKQSHSLTLEFKNLDGEVVHVKYASNTYLSWVDEYVVYEDVAHLDGKHNWRVLINPERPDVVDDGAIVRIENYAKTKFTYTAYPQDSELIQKYLAEYKNHWKQ